MSLATEELDISTSAARVDMDADRISSRIRTDSDPGITLESSSGIRASKTGLPPLKAPGVRSGLRKILLVAPVK